ncbi:ArsR/SmtB family transcription factor [Sporosarcina koreensis]|uniref:ArsR/SmtB family transcription factor n=1 Tax=Bacillales TaxID=1385 RepID=UPI00075AAB37|nr:metalloregulator ArsR/SmtB family transcription factor [Sporosarcina koreensis]
MVTTDQERDVFVAIADPTRRKLIRLLADSDELPLYELTAHFEMGRTAVSKHLAILKKADLVKNRKIGRETRYRLNAGPLQEVKDWLAFYEDFWTESAAKLKNILEE